MKILSTAQIREADAYTIAHEPIASIDLMERAASACAQWIADRHSDGAAFYIFCGTGNNGGDGLAIARILNSTKYYNIKVFVVRHSDKTSPDFSTNLSRLAKSKNVDITDISEPAQLPEIPENTVVIDALLGSGITGRVKGKFERIIDQVNAHSASSKKVSVVSVDVPSGLVASGEQGRLINAE